jgi:phospholipase C
MPFNWLRGRFRGLDSFAQDVSQPNFGPGYVFIEPNYGQVLLPGGDFRCGTSQHPLDDVTRGEKLIKDTYEAIRGSPHWGESLLILTYDEHGGFYDHVAPPAAVAPGDAITDPANNRHNFDFRQLGVRIPAVIVSPLIPRNLVDHTVYDHASVLATVEELFGLPPLTERDRKAATFSHLLSLGAARGDAPATLPNPAVSGVQGCEELAALADTEVWTADAPAAATPVDGTTVGILGVALRRHLQATPPEDHEQVVEQFRTIRTRRDAHRFLRQTRAKIRNAT